MMKMSDVDGDDGFWAIAMEHVEGQPWQEDSSDEEEDKNDDGWDGARVVAYRIPLRTDKDDGSVILRLQPLPPSDGVWAPVGADAWFASAVLASLLLSIRTDWAKEGSSIEIPSPLSSAVSMRFNSHETCKTVLELGSGAVGLSGLTCALAIGEYLKCARNNIDSSWKVLLTDYDAPVLGQLRKNVEKNQAVMSSSDVTVEVAAWDWKDTKPASGLSSSDEIVLAFGSELVYTQETAEACASLMLRLLNEFPSIQIWVVQVADRFGWWDITVPTLQINEVTVTRLQIPAEIHQEAETMVRMGGTLDRHAFEAFCIYKSDTVH